MPAKRLFICLAVTFFCADASATGLTAARFGGEHGHATTDNPTSIYFNPAGMSLLGGTRLFLGGTMAWRKFTFIRDPGGIDNILAGPDMGTGTPDGAGVAANSGQADLLNIVAAPFLGVVTDFGVPNLGVGLAFYVPFGGSSKWEGNDSADPSFPGAEDGPQRWWIIEGSLRALYFSGAVSYRVPSIRLSFGAGVNVVWSQMNTIRARNSDGTDHMTSDGNLQEGRAWVDVDGVDVSLSVGLIWEPIENLFVGVSYQSQPGFGTSRLTGETTLVFGAGPTGDIKPTPSEFFHAWPDIVRWSIRYRKPQVFEVRLFGDYTRWSVLHEQCILNTDINPRSCSGDRPPGKIVLVPRRWQDAVSLRLGGSYWLSRIVELNLGFGWDGNAVPDSTVDPALYDAHDFSLAFGARFSVLDDRLAIGVTYTQFFYLDRHIAPRGRVADPNNPDATLSNIDQHGFRPAERDPDAPGTYKVLLGALDVNVEYRF